MRIVIIAVAASLVSSVSVAQRPGGPAFDTVSVTASQSDGHRSSLTFNDQALIANNMTLSGLIESAYKIKATLIYGLDESVANQRFNIVAQRTSEEPIKKDAGYGPKELLLQNLLAAQFGLRAHVVESDLPVYELRRSGGELKLEPASSGPFVRQPGDTRFWSTNTTMAGLAEFLTRHCHRVVVDETGLTGHYDVHFSIPPHADGEPGPQGYNRPDPHPWPQENWTALDAALLQEAGLHIQPATKAIQILQVDHVELAAR